MISMSFALKLNTKWTNLVHEVIVTKQQFEKVSEFGLWMRSSRMAVIEWVRIEFQEIVD